jgi:hypothetical protein
MNAGQIARLEGFATQLDVDGRAFQVFGRGGNPLGTFCGLFAVVPPVDPNMGLGNDLREYSIITFLSTPATAQITIDSRAHDVSTNTDWRIRKRVDNDADFTTEFWVTKKLAKDT